MLFVQLTLDGYKMSRRDESKIRCHTSVYSPHHLISNTSSSSRPHHSHSLSVPTYSYSLASGHRGHAHTPEEFNELRTQSSTASPHTVAVSHCHVDVNDLNQSGHDSLSQLSSLLGENLSEGEGYEMRKSGAI